MGVKPLLIMMLVVCSLASCSTLNRYVYRTNPINLPGLTEQGQTRVTASVGGNVALQHGSGLGGLDLQGAVAVTDRLTLLGGYSARSGSDNGFNDYPPYLFNITPRRDTADDANLDYRNHTWELGAAYMVRFGRRVYMSVSAGGGMGNYHIDDHGSLYDTAYRSFLDARQGQWFIQPAMYFKLKAVELGVGFKVSEAHYSHVHTNYTDDQQVKFVVNDLQGKDITMFQPFWVLRIRPHLPWLQVELQASLNVGGNSSSAATSYYYYFLNGGVGVSIDPVRLLRGK
jgi:hypothetical protein